MYVKSEREIFDSEKKIEHIVQYYIYVKLCENEKCEWFDWRKYMRNTENLHEWEKKKR